MTVQELREALSDLDGDKRAIIPGYEAGYEEVKSLEEVEVQEQDRAEYYGNFVEKGSKDAKEGLDFEEAIKIS